MSYESFVLVAYISCSVIGVLGNKMKFLRNCFSKEAM